MAKSKVPDFKAAWEKLGNDHEIQEKYSLQFKSLPEGVQSVIDYLGMQPCDNTMTVQSQAKSHILLLSGIFLGGTKALVKSKLTLGEKGGIILQLLVRSEGANVSQTLADCIQ